MKVEILGMGCWKCKALEEMVKEVVKDLGLDAEVTKVTDINKIVGYGVVMTPGLVVNGKVRVSGCLPSRDDVEKYLKSAYS